MKIRIFFTAILLFAFLLAPINSTFANAPIVVQSGSIQMNPKMDSRIANLSEQEWASVGSQISAARYQFSWLTDSGQWAFHAPNPAQGFTVALGTNGLTLQGNKGNDEHNWVFRQRLAAYGNQTYPNDIAAEHINADREEVEYRWNQSLMEQYENTSNGLRYHITLNSPPVGKKNTLSYLISGNLTPEVDKTNDSISFLDAYGRTILHYGNITIIDAVGTSLDTRLESDGSGWQIVVTDEQLNYPINLDLIIYAEVASLHASDAQFADEFGYSVAADGDTLVVGAYFEDGGPGDPKPDSGAAYILKRNQGGADSWGEVAILRASDAQSSDNFGNAVAISGDMIAVGAFVERGGPGDPLPMAGAVYVFSRNQGGADHWGEVTVLHASDAEDGDLFGYSVAMSGDTLVVGAAWESGGLGDPVSFAGAAYIYNRNQGGADAWGEVAILHASDAQVEDQFGTSVAISGDTVVVGAIGEADGLGDPYPYAGAAYIFNRNQGGPDAWGEKTILHASDAQYNDRFGISVAISGDKIAVGAYFEDGGPGDPLSESGAAYLFQRNLGGADAWGEAAILNASDAQNLAFFGQSVAIFEDSLVVGSPNHDTGAGTAYVFTRNQGGANAWGEVQILRSSDIQPNDQFGAAVAMSEDTILVGAYMEDGAAGDPLPEVGAAYVFDYQGNQWEEMVIKHASNIQDFEHFGNSVAVNGDTLAVGAIGNGGGSGNPIPDCGAVYVFTRNEGGSDFWGLVAILYASDAQALDYFGTSVAVSGDTIAVGAMNESGGDDDPLPFAGAVYIFNRNQGGADVWGQIAELHASDAQSYDNFGISVSLSGDVLAVGAQAENGGPGDPIPHAGAVYIFYRNQGGADVWGEVAILHASDAQENDQFGQAISVSMDMVVVGVPNEDGGTGDPAEASGAAYILDRNQGGSDIWGEVTVLRASDAQASDGFGTSVAVNDGTIVVGAPYESGGPGDPVGGAGAAYIFTRNQGGAEAWGEVTKLTASNPETDAGFGYSSALSDETAVIGAENSGGPPDNPLPSTGSAYIFDRNRGGADMWGQVEIIWASDYASFDLFGHSVALSGHTLVSGAPLERGGPGDPNIEAGAAYIFYPTLGNNPPETVDDTFLVNENSQDNPLNVLTNDSDPDGDVLTISSVGKPDQGGTAINGGTVITYTPEVNISGTEIFTYTATDGLGGFDTANVTITVNPPPIVNAGDDQVGTEGQVFAFTGVYTDNKSLTSNSYIPEVEDFLWDFGDGTTVTGTLTPTHIYPDEGVFPVTLVVTDVYGAAGFDNLVVSVDNIAPLLADIPDQQVKSGEMITVTGSFTDPGLLDMHTLTVIWAPGITETMELDPGKRGFVVNHNYDATGDYEVIIIVDDHDSGLGQTMFHITVAAKGYLVYIPITRK